MAFGTWRQSRMAAIGEAFALQSQIDPELSLEGFMESCGYPQDFKRPEDTPQSANIRKRCMLKDRREKRKRKERKKRGKGEEG